MLEPIPWFVVQDAQCADVGAAWSGDWHAGIEASFDAAFHKWPISESGVLGEVVDDVRESSGVVVSRVGALVRRQVGGGFAYGQATWDLGEAQP